jgi:dihydrofolate synthase/folylpolyglutamate synthase
MLESIYGHAGFNVGAFTSPHLWQFNERIRCNGQDATDSELIALFEAIESALGSVTLSYFESSAVAALLYFARRRVDVAVLEVGMGGRLDAVNAVDTDCGSIGTEKAGIVRRDVPVVIADRSPPATVLAHVAAAGARAHLIGRDFDYERDGNTWRMRRGGQLHSESLPRPSFGGDEQFVNASGCAAVVECLTGSLPVTAAALADGIRHAELRGRLERHRVESAEWVFDVAHNPAAAAGLRESVARLPPAPRTFAVFAAMHDKDLSGVLLPFVPMVEHWFVTQANPERGALAAGLTELLSGLGARGVTPHVSVAAACAAARAGAAAGDRVLVFGSFHTVGAATAALGLYCASSRLGDHPAR